MLVACLLDVRWMGFEVEAGVGIGVAVGAFLVSNMQENGFLLHMVHHGGRMLQMDVLTENVIYLMGMPIGFKLNRNLASLFGSVVLVSHQ